MKNLFICTLLVCFIGLGFYACDSTTAPDNILSDHPAITDISVNPTSAVFDEDEHGYQDTTLSISISAQVQNPDNDAPVNYAITSKSTGEVITEGELQRDDQAFQATAEAEVTTTTIDELLIHLYIGDESGKGNSAQTRFSVQGFSNFPPIILEANNPEEFQRPESGSRDVQFTAKVTDEDGQNTIDGVYLRLFSRLTGELSEDPFKLFDNGRSQGDEVAGDSVYTLTFPVSSTNRSETYDVHYYAVDKGELVSDTVKTTFTIK